MKIQKNITAVVAFFYVVQMVFIPQGVQAQGQASSTLAAATGFVNTLPSIYSQSPLSPNFGMANTALQNRLNLCLLQSTTGITADQQKFSQSYQSTVDKWKGVLSKKDKGQKESKTPEAVCSRECAKLHEVELEPVCSDYSDDDEGEVKIPAKDGKPEKTVSGRAPKMKDWDEKIAKNQRTNIQEIIQCFKDKKEKCPDPEQAKLKTQLEIYNCQMQALQEGVQQASTALQTSIQANQKVFDDMNLHQKEVTEQMQQVDEILGPDPELGKTGVSQFQGLLGLQKELNENLPKMVEAESKFKTDIQKIKDDIRTNDQNLESSRVNVASSCIKSSRNVGVEGGYSLTCFKPVQTTGKDGAVTNVTDRNGNVKYAKQPCGPYEYIRSRIEQQAYMTSRGAILSESRREKAASNAAAFDSLMQSINRAMGDYDEKGADNARLDTEVHNWSDVETRLGANIDSVSGVSGVDVRSLLRTVGEYCFRDADVWKNKQLRSADSTYNKKKTEIKAGQNQIVSQLDSGLTSMNKSYSDVMSTMFNKHVTLNRSQCTKDNPELMQSCFAQIRQNLQNLLEGNGEMTMTAKTIKAGTSIPAFTVSCRGLNGCVTAFKNVRDSQKNYFKDVQKKKEAFVNTSNSGTKTQMMSLTNQLSAIQNTMLASYDQMKASMLKMGIDVPEKPNFMEGESLEASEGPDKSAGPFKSPGNMSKVLSGMMQPSGMINFSDTGMRQPLKDLAEKEKERKAAIDEDVKKYKDVLALYSREKIKSACKLVDGLSPSSDGKSQAKVNNMEQSCDSCAVKANACQMALGDIKQKVDDNNTRITELDGKIKKEKNAEKKKALEDERKALVEENRKYQNSDKMSENIKVLGELADIFSKMANQTSSSEEYEKLNNKNMGVLDYLNESPGCKGVLEKCNLCKTEGKGVYTQDSKGSDPNVKTAD